MEESVAVEADAALGEGVTADVPGDRRMENTMTLLYWDQPGPAELNVMRIVQFLGASVRLLKLTRDGPLDEEVPDRRGADGRCLITSAETISQIARQGKGYAGLRRLLGTPASNAFVYGFEPIASHGSLLQELTSGSIAGVESLQSEDLTFRVDQGARDICRQFSRLSFEAADPSRDFAFVGDLRMGQCSSLIRIGQEPFLVRATYQGCSLLLSACLDTADLDGPVATGESIIRYFSRVSPLMMFVRHAQSDGLWHTDTPSACFIVDDPLLKRRYGFLDYEKLRGVIQ